MVRVELRPAAENTGVVFCREDLPGASVIPATLEHLRHSRLATTLGLGASGPVVATVEHLLAALWARGVHNVEVGVWGSELPALDGSAAPWIDAIEGAGTVEQSVALAPLVVLEPVEVRIDDRWARVVPAPVLSLCVEIEFAHALIGRQRLDLVLENGTFESELAWARTFGFLEEVEALQAQGFACGGSLENAVVYGAEGVLNSEGLRSPDEAVRHKALDLLGDLALLGRPVVGRVETERPGHVLNLALARALLQRARDWDER
jgi:UDP-3-O-[3-hydroxymyristoyl] N-acetylglucosamine deacetylase